MQKGKGQWYGYAEVAHHIGVAGIKTCSEPLVEDDVSVEANSEALHVIAIKC